MKPNVLCVGFAKCGTTTLYDIMKQHPDIYLSGIKEPIYYGSEKLVRDKGFSWYQKRYYASETSRKVVMEINPILGRDVDPRRIKEDYGSDIKIIFLVRNPVDRLYSEFRMNLIDGTCFQDIEKNISPSTLNLFKEWLDENFVLENGNYCLRRNYSTKFCDSGEYYDRIKSYIEVFGIQRVKVILFEDFVKFPREVCHEIFDFISVSTDASINYDIHSNDGNRIPVSRASIIANRIWFLKIYKSFLIEKVPYVTDSMCKFINDISWKVPILFSKVNSHPEKVDLESRCLIQDFYYDMVSDLEKLLGVDLLNKWGFTLKRERD